MLIVALVLAAVGLAALVTAVVTSNEVLAFVCIAAAAVGVVLMIIDAIRDRHAGALDADEESDEEADVDASESGDADSDHDADADADGDVKADAAEADPSQTSVLPQQVSEKSAPAAAVSLKEAATAAHHHPSAEETYEQFDIDDEDEDEPHRP
ncbi:Uncharacterised protein [Mycobacteroides abscessus subsp. bolletii]|uniref:Transmembrane protein n=1 Tax=Mycobacteroides abscessus subsp. bolletii TaxID=319705 RepID=A0A9Q7WLJ9_9MYCO|nr:hypothetical protein [Mycobacteroides abscessus]SHU95341.1 Uncharacterised protein [Mycobacteroides abscessus subsp. bolletii]SHV62083.1 Uncharacterised protein [Mycobacteroides abscessus subsp. bolletii]SHY07925.1 Uncharacterised protein [Mycobacteroides abscessus subsp. bolletii]SKM56018.1 Uncharacterised protein [Mycobacteroides abscessus subsp. bolletii]SKM79359.1 Uncharacterised protein [Mycobacteroides abscessus subsp. bolletii]